MAALCLLGLSIGTPAHAQRHQALRDAVQLAESADFQGALTAFARAERAHDLTREDLIELLTERPLVHAATGGLAAMREDRPLAQGRRAP